jgi:hypothetical protein
MREEVATKVPNCPLPASMKEPVKPAREAMPPWKVDVAVEVPVTVPVVNLPTVDEAKYDDTTCARFAKNDVVVAFVERRFVKVDVAVDVAVMTPAVSWPMVEEETSSCGKAKSDEVA